MFTLHTESVMTIERQFFVNDNIQKILTGKQLQLLNALLHCIQLAAHLKGWKAEAIR